MTILPKLSVNEKRRPCAGPPRGITTLESPYRNASRMVANAGRLQQREVLSVMVGVTLW